MSRRRGHCPERGRGESGGGGAGGPGRLGRGSAEGPRHWSLRGARGLAPSSLLSPPRAGTGSRGRPVPAARGGSRVVGWGRGAGAAAAPAPARIPAPGLATLRPGKFPPNTELRELRAPSPPPAQPGPPGVGGGVGLCTRGHRPGGTWAPILTFPGLQMAVDWERAPDSWYPSSILSL